MKAKESKNKPHRIEFDNNNNQEAGKLVDEIKRINRENKDKKPVCIHSNGTLYNFDKWRDINQFGNYILYGAILIEEAKDEQDEMKGKMRKLENYNPTNKQKVNSIEEVLITQKNFLI